MVGSTYNGFRKTIKMDTLIPMLKSKAIVGPWIYQEDSDAYTHIVRPQLMMGRIICHLGQDTSGEAEDTARMISATPEAIGFISDLMEFFDFLELCKTDKINIEPWRNKAEGILKKAYNF